MNYYSELHVLNQYLINAIKNKPQTILPCTLLICYKKQFEDYLVVLQSLDTKTEVQQCIQERFIELSTYYINLGNQELSKTLKSNNAQTKEVYVLHYAFPETFKEAFLLHRDVLLQLQIATQKELEGVVVEESALNHLQSSIKILTEATAFAIKQLVHEQNAMGSSEKEIGKRLNSIKHRQKSLVYLQRAV